jgi:uncharacterized damage-inducible protein DinB
MEFMYDKLWKMGRNRLTNQIESIEEADLLKRLHPDSASAGWLLRHIAEVELLFAKNVFGREITVKAQTIGPIGKDRDQFNKLKPLLDMIEEAEKELGQAIGNIGNWDEDVSTAEFGTVTKAEALGRILTHTAYHAGQLALILKYGNKD